MRATAQQYATAWYDSLQSADAKEWDGISQRYLQHMHHAGDMNMLADVQREMGRLEQADRGVMQVTVRAARDLDRKTIDAAVQQVFGKKEMNVEVVVDPSVIGGVQIETDDRRWDLSLRGQLRALEQQLTA